MVVLLYLMDSTKSIFDTIDDWNKILSFTCSIGAILASVFSFFYIIKGIGLEDPTKYTFKDISEKDRYIILKPVIATIITFVFGFFLGLSTVPIQLFPNLSYDDVLFTYILSGIFFLVLFIVFTFFFNTFPYKLLRVPYYFYKKITKNRSFILSAIAKLLLFFVYFMMLIISLIPIFILGVIVSFDSTIYIFLSSFIFSFYAVAVTLAIVHDEEDVIFPKIFGSIFIIAWIVQFPGCIYYIKKGKSLIDKITILRDLKKLDDLIDKFIPISIDGYFIFSCVITFFFLLFMCIYLYKKIYSSFSKRQNLAYFYAETEDNKKVYIYSKLDNYFLCNTKDYIECSYIEQKERIEKIYKFKRKILKSDFFLNNKLDEKKYKKLYYDLIDDMFYYIKYLDEFDNDMKNLFCILDKANVDTRTSLYKNIKDIRKIFISMDKKIALQFIEISDIKNKTTYCYRKNIKKFKKNL